MIRKPATATRRASKSASQLPSQPALTATSYATTTTTELPFEEPQADQHPTAHNSENSSTPAELKKTRGKTTGKGMIEMIASNGNKKVEIIFDQEHWVPNTEYSNKKFTTAIGIEVRSRAPVCYRGWNKISGDIKRTLREGLTVHFDVEIEHPKIIYFVDDKMRSAYTQFKWKLHDHYQKCGTSVRGRATLPPPDLWGERSTEEWHWLCDELYTDPKYIDKCKKNSTSRKRQRSTHRGGAMPFIQHALRTAKEGNPLSFIDNWAAMYQDSNSNWVSDVARDKYVSIVINVVKVLLVLGK
ncbi:hypothetical protein RchiOBHm_Chr5g0025151 [Rosa chinensis]|uniref:Transposase, Ptta/En/Spm, plant n=1 Tax=Rosa chinensis TaxID=74649 RepID=A0A2P6Q8I9_ROSCH|nr:hypothetical protein RchiOBHm_Chr5g0025151 [Rosa chinensis]